MIVGIANSKPRAMRRLLVQLWHWVADREGELDLLPRRDAGGSGAMEVGFPFPLTVL